MAAAALVREPALGSTIKKLCWVSVSQTPDIFSLQHILYRQLFAKPLPEVATDEHSFDLFISEQEVQLVEGEYPSVETMVEFAAWLTRRRERVCLAQRVGGGPRLQGLVRTTIRNMLTELFAHAWPRRWAAYAALDWKERAAYEDAILKEVDGLHKQAALTMSAAR